MPIARVRKTEETDDRPLFTLADTENWRKTPEEITELARDIVTNVVYITTGHQDIGMQFMVLMFVNWDGEEPLKKIGALYEEYGKANPMGVNGLPTFFSCRFVHVDDMDFLRTEVERLETALGIVRTPPVRRTDAC